MPKFDQQKFNQFVIEQKILGFFPQPVKLVSGRISSWYVNWRNVSNEVFLIDKLSDFLLNFLESKKITYDCIYGTPDGATKLAVISQYKWASQQPDFKTKQYILSMGRKTPKDHGDPKDKFFVGAPQGKVVVIEDVTTTGGSLLKTVERLIETNIEVVAAVALTNRNEVMDDGRHVSVVLQEKGVEYLAMSQAVDLIPAMIQNITTGITEEFKQYGEKEIVF